MIPRSVLLVLIDGALIYWNLVAPSRLAVVILCVVLGLHAVASIFVDYHVVRATQDMKSITTAASAHRWGA